MDAKKIRKCFVECGGNSSEAARRLGVSRDTVFRACRDLREKHPARPNGSGPKPPSFDAIPARMRRAPMTIDEVAAASGHGKKACLAWIEAQVAAGLNVHRIGDAYSVERDIRPSFDAPLMEVVSDRKHRFRIGAMGDTHLGSKYERLDVLNGLYDIYRERGVRDVFHAGNWIDGEARFNRLDLHTHGMDAQIDYLVKTYPQRRGVTTHAIAGDDHEGWYAQREGINIGRRAEQAFRDAGRSDWRDLGYMEAYVRLVNASSGQSAIMAVVHPGGGSAYATSYTVQKIVESYGGGEKPAVLLAGHYHKMEQINIRNVWVVQTGCCMDQTPFMRKKKIEAHVGGHVLDLVQDPATGAIVEMNGQRRYFTTGYYNNRWSHSGPVTLPERRPGGLAK